jgi:hypothetical protein
MTRSIYEILTNRLGNALALINLFLITLHASGISERLGLTNLIRLSFLVSVPSRIAAGVLFNERLLPYWSFPSSLAKYSLITLTLIYFQWVTIGWLAQKISAKVQPRCF